MSTSFSISRSRFFGLSDRDRHQEIQSHTGSPSETDSILRSMARFGDDATIRFYEMIPQPRRGARRSDPSSTWTVRAVRDQER